MSTLEPTAQALGVDLGPIRQGIHGSLVAGTRQFLGHSFEPLAQ